MKAQMPLVSDPPVSSFSPLFAQALPPRATAECPMPSKSDFVELPSWA
jgi:hypothetical protein